MRKLLKKNEVRRIALIEELNLRNGWVTLNELSKKLNYSESTLKEDMAYFRKKYTYFQIESSYEGIRIEFKPNAGLKTFYQSIIEDSLAFNVIESVLYVESISEADLIDQFFISQSTLYRLIKEINLVLKNKFDIELSTNPLTLIGSEEKIRYFYYIYFNERYSELDWPLPSIDKESFDQLLQGFLEIIGLELNFSDYLNFKLVTIINLFRYKNNHLIDRHEGQINFAETLNHLPVYEEKFRPLEEKLQIKINQASVSQIFFNYISYTYSPTYTQLMEKTKTDSELEKTVTYLSELIDQISVKFALPVENKETIILRVSNVAYNELSKPQSDYLLYNRMAYSLKRFSQNFPEFTRSVVDGLKQYRRLIKVPEKFNTIDNLFIEFVFSWENIIYELQNQWPKTKILVVSDVSIGHASTIRDILRFNFGNKVKIDIFEDYNLSEEGLEEDYPEIIVANFPIESLKDSQTIYIENIPTMKNLSAITQAISHSNLLKKTHNYYTN